jgi:alcohol dehydrogenase
VISISGPPDAGFATEIGLSWPVKIIFQNIKFRNQAESKTIWCKAIPFLFMRANGSQLSEITSLINAGIIKPVMDKIFPFEQTNEALMYVEAGHAKGKGGCESEIEEIKVANSSNLQKYTFVYTFEKIVVYKTTFVKNG